MPILSIGDEEHWVEDADWDQADWDEWDRREMLREAGMRRRLAPLSPSEDSEYRHQWHNMVTGTSVKQRSPRF